MKSDKNTQDYLHGLHLTQFIYILKLEKKCLRNFKHFSPGFFEFTFIISYRKL